MAITIEQALEHVYKNTKQISTNLLPIEEILGLVLAQEIVASHSLPPFDNSAMDGYAVKVCDASKRVKVVQTIFAGDNSNFELESGFAIKIMTGARIPTGCEAIVPIEDVVVFDDEIELPQMIKFGRHIRKRGEDIECSKVILKMGTRIYAHHITLLASQGISHVKVYKKPRVSVFASGSELKMHHEKLESHQLYNTNSPTFLARVKELGCDGEFLGTSGDSLEEIKSYIENALGSDLIITSGGVSVGDADFTKEAFSAFGYEIFFDKVEIKPGKPTTFGRIKDTLVLNLPGNPMAAALNFELFAKSIILALSGDKERFIGFIETKMAFDFELKSGKRTLIAGNFNGTSFAPFANSAPGMITPMAESNAYAIIDSNFNMLKKDEIIKIIPTRFWLNSTKPLNLIN